MLWSAAPIERESIRDYRLILTNLLRTVLPEPLVQTDAPERVELLLHRDGDVLRLGAVQLSEDDRIERAYPFRVSVRSDRARTVCSLPDGAEIPSSYHDDYVSFKVENLHIYRLFALA